MLIIYFFISFLDYLRTTSIKIIPKNRIIKIAQKQNVRMLLNNKLTINPIIAMITYIIQMFLIKFSIMFFYLLINTSFIFHNAK